MKVALPHGPARRAARAFSVRPEAGEARKFAAAVVALLATWGCSDPDGPTMDATGDAAGDATEGGGEAGDAEADSSPPPGPITIVTETIELSTERLCDLDGNGTDDNVLADLGPTDSQLLAIAVNSFIASSYPGNYPFLMHVPWVDDRAGPTDDDVALLLFEGLDDEHFATGSRDRTDDFSGEEPFVVRSAHLDECGEPLWGFDGVSLQDGAFRTESPSGLFVPITSTSTLPMSGGQIDGALEPGGAGGSWHVCGYATLSDLGQVDTGMLADTSMLELLLAGGAVLGYPTLSGLTPDVDVDGDGLERIVLDDESHIELCVDGDDTTILGRDCYLDPRIADAMALTMAMEGVAAEFVGREPDWPERVEGTCDTPPSESLWDPD